MNNIEQINHCDLDNTKEVKLYLVIENIISSGLFCEF